MAGEGDIAPAAARVDGPTIERLGADPADRAEVLELFESTFYAGAEAAAREELTRTLETGETMIIRDESRIVAAGRWARLDESENGLALYRLVTLLARRAELRPAAILAVRNQRRDESIQFFDDASLKSIPPACSTDAGLTHLAVAPDHRRRGHGERLARARIEAARTSGARSVFVQCWSKGMSQELYAKLGFLPVACLVHRDRSKGTIMVLPLAAPEDSVFETRGATPWLPDSVLASVTCLASLASAIWLAAGWTAGAPVRLLLCRAVAGSLAFELESLKRRLDGAEVRLHSHCLSRRLRDTEDVVELAQLRRVERLASGGLAIVHHRGVLTVPPLKDEDALLRALDPFLDAPAERAARGAYREAAAFALIVSSVGGFLALVSGRSLALEGMCTLFGAHVASRGTLRRDGRGSRSTMAFCVLFALALVVAVLSGAAGRLR
jgi:GNAT superfamily N-acetyltransferase